MTSTPVGMRCPECARQRTTVRSGVRSTSEDPTLTYVLIGINVAVALGSILGGGGATGGVGGSSLLEEGSVSRATIADGEYWRLLTAGFLHSGFFHLAFNMLSLYILGGLLEPAVGRFRFALIYFVSLLAGSFGALLLEPDSATVGASGAIFGLMGAGVVVMRSRGLSIMESGLGLWIGLNLLLTFSVPGISIGGHLGGLFGGTVAALLLFDLRDRVRVSAAIPTGICVAIAVASVAGAIAISS
jgi:membrane associated rhomboid family serine protease